MLCKTNLPHLQCVLDMKKKRKNRNKNQLKKNKHNYTFGANENAIASAKCLKSHVNGSVQFCFFFQNVNASICACVSFVYSFFFAYSIGYYQANKLLYVLNKKKRIKQTCAFVMGSESEFRHFKYRPSTTLCMYIIV